MAGAPRRRARAEAQLIAMGIEPSSRPVSVSHGPARRSSKPAAQTEPVGELPEVLLEQLSAASQLGFDAETRQQFTYLRGRAFGFARAVMEIPLDPASKHFAKVLSVQQAITVALLNATTRVRPGDLRDKDDDGIGELLEEVRAAARKSPISGADLQALHDAATKALEEDPLLAAAEERARRELMS